MHIARPSHCDGCSKWEEECKRVCEKESPDSLFYGVECGRCNNKRKTCWMAILPDGWLFNTRAEDGENSLLCTDCVGKYHDMVFDDWGYNILEFTSW